MRSSTTISLFSAQPELNQKPYSFMVSALTHSAVIGLLLFGVMSAPQVKTPVLAERYTVRHLDLQSLDSEMERAAESAVDDMRLHDKAQTPPSGGSPEAQQPLMRQFDQAKLARQTLVQPDVPKPLTLPVDISLPSVVIWNAANTPAKAIVAPLPQKPPVANVKPSMQKPNEEVLLANVAIPAAKLPSMNQILLPRTTAPLVVQGPKPTPPAPITTAAGSAHSTSATVMSLSNNRMAKGVVNLPPVNMTASSNSQGSLMQGQANNSSQTGQGHGNVASKSGGSGEGQHPGNSSNSGGAGQGSKIGFGQGGQFSTVHITRQQDGKFGAVVMGSSLVEKYPETAELWNGRVSYTVYLHMGLAKSWIMQYSIPRSGGAAGAVGAAHIEAPWPFSIVRPNIAPGSIDADALMVHGFVNQAGRFESLAVAFPPQFAQAQFVLNSLAQWQFRPATQNGQNIKVEVLLIIPDMLE
jgi:hypothetical protein